MIAQTMRYWSIEAMFTCMLRFRSVREEALIVVEREYFSKLGEGYLALLFELIGRLSPDHEARERIPYVEIVNAALDETIPRHAGQAGLLAKDEIEKLLVMPSVHHPDVPGQKSWGLMYRSYHELTDDDVSRDQGFKLIAEFVQEQGYYEPLRAALTHEGIGTVVNIRSLVEVHTTILDRVEAISEDPCLGLTPREGQFQSVELFSTGITWLDNLIGGGQAAPEACGLLGPTGGGKSTLVMQMALMTSKRLKTQHYRHGAPLRHVMVLSYEDDPQRLLARALCRVARIDKDEVMAMDATASTLSRTGHLKDYERKYFAGEDGFDPDTFAGEYERMRAAQAKFNVNFHMVYIGSKGIGYRYVDEIAAILARAQDRNGWKLAAVYVDSIDWLVGNHLSAQGLSPRDHKRGSIMEAVPQLRRKVGERFNSVVWITNQLAGAHLKRPSTVEFGHSEAGDSKDWGRALDIHAALGNLDHEQNTVLHISKARRSSTRGLTRVVGLRGAMAQFVSLAKDYTISNGVIVRRDIDEIVVPVPTARTKRKTAGNSLGDEDSINWSSGI